MPILDIARLGAQGDGIADTPSGPVFVPFALAGETVNAAVVRDRGTLVSVNQASPLRVEPPCRHFGECGGCTIQHLEDNAYRDWKQGRVVEQLARERLEATVEPLVPCQPASRRRVTFTARRTERGIVLGYNRMHSHEIIAIEECPIALPRIVEALPAIRTVASLVARTKEPFHVTVTAAGNGLDIAATGGGKLEDADRRAAADAALALGVARLSVDGEIVVEPTRPQILFGRASVTPPPGGFLQAVEAAEQAMAGLVCDHLAKSRKVADLFSGSGTFALRLAERSEVRAVEGDAAALAALERGFRFAPGLRRVTTEKRDLFRRPLTAKELDAFDGLVFDPPRAGAEDQSRQIARSQVQRVAAVSCNPVTLARDLRILVDGGYRILRVVPIDQFLWSGHVEAVVLLEKPKRRR